MRCNRCCFILSAASLALVAGGAFAGPISVQIRTLVLEGDVIPGLGAVTAIDAVTVNDSGQWMVEVDTDFADTNFDGAVLRDCDLYLREGDPLPVLRGASIDSFDSVWINGDGNVAWNLFIDGVPSSQDSGLFHNTTLLIQEGDFSTAAEFSPNTPYIGFFEARLNDAGSILVVASVDDPKIASSVDRALVWVEYEPGDGVVSETVLAKEGDVLPGVEDAVVDFGTGPENFAINNAGQVLYTVSLTGPAATNGAVYLDDVLLARKGDPSPAPDRIYSNIGTSTRVDVNDRGDTVFLTGLSGDAATNQIIVRNGEKFMQRGDAVPAAGGATIATFNTAPVRIANDGDVIWYATLDGDPATNQVLCKGDQVLVRKGETLIDGMTLTTIAGTTATGGITEGLAISPDGRHVIFRGVLDGSLVGAFLVSFEDDGEPSDLNGDGNVDGADLGLLLVGWGPCVACDVVGCAADLNGDGMIDGADLGVMLGAWTPPKG